MPEATGGAALREERESAELGQEAIARAMDVSVKTIQRLEKSLVVKRRDAAAYRTALRSLVAKGSHGATHSPDNDVPRDTSAADTWSPNPALKGIIPQRAYDTALDYCRRLVRAGLPTTEIERLERVMIDTRYAKANSRRGRELPEEDWIILVDDVWDAIRETLGAQGIHV